MERVAEAGKAEADRRKRVAAMVQLAEDSLAEQLLADGIVDEDFGKRKNRREEVVTPAKPEIVRGSSELLPPTGNLLFRIRRRRTRSPRRLL